MENYILLKVIFFSLFCEEIMKNVLGLFIIIVMIIVIIISVSLESNERQQCRLSCFRLQCE